MSRMTSQRALRCQPRVCYFEPDEPNLDEYVFCEKCGDYIYEYCSIHGGLAVILDDKVPAKSNYPSHIPRAALTIPRVFLHFNYSTIPGAGLGVFTTLTLPSGVRFGPYRGERTNEITSCYSWQIYDRNRKPSHLIDAFDANKSNWMRYVNCSRHWVEQNLIAFQYQGELYYRTIRIIPKYTELMVFYGSQYANQLDIDLAKYNSPSGYAQKFGAPPPKKPKFGVETKTILQATFSKPFNVYQETDKSKEYEITSNSNVSGTSKNLNNLKQNTSKFDEGAPAPKKPKFAPQKKKSRQTTFVAPSKQNKGTDELVTTWKATANTNIKEAAKIVKKSKIIKPQTKKDTSKKRKNEASSNESPIIDNLSKLTSQSSLLHTQSVKNQITNVIEKEENNDKLAIFKPQCENNNNNIESVLELKEIESEKNINIDAKLIISNKCIIKKSTCNKQKQNYQADKNKKIRVEIHKAYFYCDVCNYRSITKESLIKHMTLHDINRQFACDRCCYRYLTISTLNYHKCTIHGIQTGNTHTGEKPYSCDICDYKCAQACNLKKHLRIHTGEKPYSCDICDYKCSRADTLKNHLRIHTGEKPYSCDICDYKCSRAGNLKIHLRIHTGEKPYSCDICDYKCAHSVSLKHHLNNKHLN